MDANPCSVGGKQLCDVSLGATRETAIKQFRCLPAHQVCGLDVRVRQRDRELHALIGSYRAAKYHAALGVIRGPINEPAAIANALSCDQDPLGVESIKEIPEPETFLTDEIFSWNHEISDEQLCRVMVEHHSKWPDLDGSRGDCFFERYQKDRETFSLV